MPPLRLLHRCRAPALVAAAGLSLGACSISRPAAPIAPTPRPAALPSAGQSVALSGSYRVVLTAPFIGRVETRMLAVPTEEGFIASTREGVAWELIGGIEGVLGSVFMPKLFPRGVLLTWTSPAPDGETPVEGRIGAGQYRNAVAITRMTSAGGDIEILTRDGRKIGIMRVEPLTTETGEATDYVQLAERMERAVRKRLFDGELARSGPVRRYLSRVGRNARIATDDVEFIFGAVVAGRGLGFSMPLVMRDAPLDSASNAGKWSEDDLATISVEFDSETRIASVRVEAFLSADDVDAAFRRVLAMDPAGLFIDLRACPGVTLASLRTLSWISDEPVDAGDFFGPEHRNAMLSSSPPPLPVALFDSAPAVADAERVLDEQGALRIQVVPVERPFRGPVAVAIGKRTTTSAEPLVHLLKSSGRAHLFGARTAGRPLLSRPVAIGQGWVLWLATNDYRPRDGQRIAQGIEPHETVAGKSEAREAAFAWLRERIREATSLPVVMDQR